MLALAPLAAAADCAPGQVDIRDADATLRFHVEVVDTADERALGLMNRESLPRFSGMLFVYDRPQPVAFWMKNTLIPLDILYFDTDRRLVSMQLNVPPCKGDPCPIYPSNAPARYVLEVSAGTAHRIGAQVGDELKIDGDIGTVR